MTTDNARELDPHELDAHIEAFENAWSSEPPADLIDFARSRSPEIQCEVILVDLEQRYRSKRGTLTDELGHQPRIEDYVSYVERFGIHVAISLELIAEEYRARTIWGDQPSLKHYQQRFPEFTSELPRAFQLINAELRAEQAKPTNPTVDFDPRAPLRHQDFEIQQLVGSGTVGKVYRCHQKSMNRFVAMKAIHKKLLDDTLIVDAFLREGQILARLDHPGIVRMFGMGRFPNGGYFQILELIEGMNLRSWLNSENKDSRVACRILLEIAAAVEHAHQHNVIHCDLKPENILLSEQRVTVADFGMARLASRSPRAIGGTQRYAAPEANRDEAITAAVDVYAIGVIGQEILRHVESESNSDSESNSNLLNLLRQCCALDASTRPNISAVNKRLRHLQTN